MRLCSTMVLVVMVVMVVVVFCAFCAFHFMLRVQKYNSKFIKHFYTSWFEVEIEMQFI